MSRIVVVGASGNVGTAVLRALVDDAEITSVLGIVRRPPATEESPYADVEWAAVDIAEGSHIVEDLTGLFAGADAVIHLAWQIQPNTRRSQLREVNVEGTRRVAHAVGRAGVPQFLVASSWAAYSPDPEKQLRAEDWPTGGVRSSHYSVDKAAQERVLDEFEEANPQVRVGRLRTALVFQRDAGASITRYFIGPYLPPSLLRPGTLPVVPLPTGVQAQVIHADDAAAAYLTVLRAGAHGGFNVAADPILDVSMLGEVLGQGRTVEVPWRAIRPLLYYGHKARLAAADEGWLDMARELPMMDTTRIKDLGWQPRHSAQETLKEMLDGIASSAGRPTPVMAPDLRNFGDLDEVVYDTAAGEVELPQLPADVGPVPDHIDASLLGLYLSDHLTGATAGKNRIHQMVQSYGNTRIGPDLARVSKQIDGECDFLNELIHALGLRERGPRQALGAIGERAGRLKLNQRAFQPSPMTPLLELELMRSAVIGKRSGWQVLATYAEDLGMPERIFLDLAHKAEEQAELLESLHERVRVQAFYTAGQHVA
ncbi:MAG TPA: NAD-dependent epimerase/dehydratase family protein [Beutenbergiaceae bacterium]|nr:NAD-dependent epimerase/dehydratase family protein [Beutenbergiaceae bacterium]